jgi:hypothetical protein
MSAKNVMNSDYLVKNLLDVIAKTPTSAADVWLLWHQFSVLSKKKKGYVRIGYDYSVNNGGDAQTCTVTVAVGRTNTALGEKNPYTDQPVVTGSRFGVGHYVSAVEAGLL